MQPKISTFRPGGGLVVPSGPTGRPSATSVGVGPVGCAWFGDDAYVNQTAHAGMDGASTLLQWSTSFFDWLVPQHVTGQYAEALTGQIKAEREFALTKRLIGVRS